MKVITIAANDLRRLLRWRGNLFFSSSCRC